MSVPVTLVQGAYIVAGLAFILARRDAITAMCYGPSERFVVERTLDALADQQQGGA